jgi:hypothetical protein
MRLVLPSFLLAAHVATPLTAQEAAPKLGTNAVPITADNAYIRTNDAPDYWAFAPFVKRQFTTPACSIATITAAQNGLIGLAPNAEDTIMTPQVLLVETDDATWSELFAEGGDGVTLQQFVDYTKLGLTAMHMDRTGTESHTAEVTPEPTEQVGTMLAANEASADYALLLYFNQGVVTGDWDGPDISLIGAYDAAKDAVLILEVDQEWYIPYWRPVDVLMQAMIKPASAEHGSLEGEIGGFVMIEAPAG